MKEDDLFTSPSWQYYGKGKPQEFKGRPIDFGFDQGLAGYDLEQGLIYLDNMLGANGRSAADQIRELHNQFSNYCCFLLCLDIINYLEGEEGIERLCKMTHVNRCKNPKAYLDHLGVDSFKKIATGAEIKRHPDAAPVRRYTAREEARGL